MPFFVRGSRGARRLKILKSLTDYEYYETVPLSEDAQEFADEMDFATFAVRLGWTKQQFLSITPTERLFILKEFEKQEVRNAELLQAIIETAIYNTSRKKGKKRHQVLTKKKKKDQEAPISKKQFKDLKEAFKKKFGGG